VFFCLKVLYALWHSLIVICVCELLMGCTCCVSASLQNIEHSRHAGPAVGVEYDVTRSSSSRLHQSPMENICPDLAARIIEDALSPTPLQNVDLTSRCWKIVLLLKESWNWLRDVKNYFDIFKQIVSFL